MSEYIIDWFGLGCDFTELKRQGVSVFLWPKRIQEKRRLERIIRCRDCRFSAIHDGKRFPKGEAYKGAMYCIAWSDGFQGEWTDPDGYCHRAKPKEEA